ncbi:hypothetical protein J2T20_000343 [Paenibacillus wynnii]|nr:hypothetical protein [Paenibacillus wynnii]
MKERYGCSLMKIRYDPMKACGINISVIINRFFNRVSLRLAFQIDGLTGILQRLPGLLRC